MGSRSPCVQRQFWGRKGAGPGHARACPAVDILKATQQGAAPVRCGCRLGLTRWGCTLAPPGEYDWTVRVRRRCSLITFFRTSCHCVSYFAARLLQLCLPIYLNLQENNLADTELCFIVDLRSLQHVLMAIGCFPMSRRITNPACWVLTYSITVRTCPRCLHH